VKNEFVEVFGPDRRNSCGKAQVRSGTTGRVNPTNRADQVQYVFCRVRMVQKLAMHSPGVPELQHNRLFDLRTGHTNSNSRRMTLGPSVSPECATLAFGHKFLQL